MLEVLGVSVAILLFLGLGAGTVYWGMSHLLDTKNKVIDDLRAENKQLEEDNNALEDAHNEILEAWVDSARAADLPPVERIGMLLSFHRRRRQARDVPGASDPGRGPDELEPARDPEGSNGPGSDGHDPVRRPHQDPGKPEPVDRTRGSLQDLLESEEA